MFIVKLKETLIKSKFIDFEAEILSHLTRWTYLLSSEIKLNLNRNSLEMIKQNFSSSFYTTDGIKSQSDA